MQLLKSARHSSFRFWKSFLEEKEPRSPRSQIREITEIEQQLLDTLFRVILNDLQRSLEGYQRDQFQDRSHRHRPAEPADPFAYRGSSRSGFRGGDRGDHIGKLNLAIPAINIKMVGQAIRSTVVVAKGSVERSRSFTHAGICRRGERDARHPLERPSCRAATSVEFTDRRLSAVRLSGKACNRLPDERHCQISGPRGQKVTTGELFWWRNYRRCRGLHYSES